MIATCNIIHWLDDILDSTSRELQEEYVVRKKRSELPGDSATRGVLLYMRKCCDVK